MLKRVTLIVLVTVLAGALATGDFYLMRALPLSFAGVIHNVLASLIGVCFVVTALDVERKDHVWDLHSLFLLGVGVAMLAIHVAKLFLSRC